MKLKKNKIQFWIGIFCIILSLLGSIFGSYNIYKGELNSFVEKIADSYPYPNDFNLSDGESSLIMHNLVSHVELGIVSIKTSWYNFILGNIIIFLFGLNFIFQSLNKE